MPDVVRFRVRAGYADVVRRRCRGRCCNGRRGRRAVAQMMTRMERTMVHGFFHDARRGSQGDDCPFTAAGRPGPMGRTAEHVTEWLACGRMSIGRTPRLFVYELLQDLLTGLHQASEL